MNRKVKSKKMICVYFRFVYIKFFPLNVCIFQLYIRPTLEDRSRGKIGCGERRWYTTAAGETLRGGDYGSLPQGD